MRTRAALLVPAVLLCLGTVVSGCSGGSSGGSSGGAGSGSVAVGSDSAGAASRPGAKQAAVADAAPAALQARAVVRTGEMSLASKDPGAVLTRVHELLVRVGGTVDREQTTHTPSGRIRRSTLVLRVPVARFEATRRQLSGFGTVLDSTEAAKDVTTAVIDTRERVQTLQNSLDRLHRFQRSATDAKDLLEFEQQITERQAELQSLTAQRDYLTGQSSMSTLTLHVTRPEVHRATPGALHDAGFLSGLSGGWHALLAVGLVGLTALGAALPFAPVLALLGLLGWRLRRRAGAGAGASASAEPSAG